MFSRVCRCDQGGCLVSTGLQVLAAPDLTGRAMSAPASGTEQGGLTLRQEEGGLVTFKVNKMDLSLGFVQSPASQTFLDRRLPVMSQFTIHWGGK